MSYMAHIEPKLKQRSTGELIHWTPGTYRPSDELQFHRNIDDLTVGSQIGLKTLEGGVVRVSLSKIDKGAFKGTFIDMKPEQPRSEPLREAEIGDEIGFKAENIFFVFHLEAR